MTARDDDAIAARRPLTRETLRTISPLPPPEEVFADWLMALPQGACIEAAARREIARIDGSNLFHPDLQCLRMLLVAVAGSTSGKCLPQIFS